MNIATPSSKVKSRASLPGNARVLKSVSSKSSDDERIGASRLLKLSATQSFEEQRAAARAWREKTQGVQSRGLFSPSRPSIDSNSSGHGSGLSQEVQVETASEPVDNQEDEKVSNAPEAQESTEEDIVVLASNGKQKESEPVVETKIPFGFALPDDTSASLPSESTKQDEKKTTFIASLISKITAFTGFDVLGFYERWFLLAVFVVSPVWLYQLDQCQLWLNEHMPSPCCYKECAMKLLLPVIQRLEVLSPYQIAAILIGGLVMSYTLDRQTKETDDVVCGAVRRVRALCGLSVIKSSDNTSGIGTSTLFSKPFSAWFTAVVLVSFGVRIVLTQTFVVIVVTLKPLMKHIYPILALLLLLIVLYRYLLHRYRTAKARKELCGQLSVLTKQILQLHASRPYPIEYVYEEVNDALQRAARSKGSTTGTATSAAVPTTGPAPVVFGETGVPETKPASSTVMHSIYNLIFSPSKTSVTVPSHSDSEEAQLRRQLMSEIQQQAEQITLGAYRLTSLWKEVVKLVEGDKRVQTVDLVVDGAQRRCWRVLSGSGGGVSALFGGK